MDQNKTHYRGFAEDKTNLSLGQSYNDFSSRKMETGGKDAVAVCPRHVNIGQLSQAASPLSTVERFSRCS